MQKRYGESWASSLVRAIDRKEKRLKEPTSNTLAQRKFREKKRKQKEKA